ncbi:MAG TPA: hypothetical protein VHX16_19595 [Chloroflexota bacterium]|nr:hypothetical protein [Chloroflexota bacterium]
MASPGLRRWLWPAIAVGGIVVATACGGLIVATAREIGDSILQEDDPSTTISPVAQRRWYARARFLTPDGTVSPASANGGDVR